MVPPDLIEPTETENTFTETASDFTNIQLQVILISILSFLAVVALVSFGCTIYKYKRKYEWVDGKLQIKQSYQEEKAEELRKAQELRRSYVPEEPPDVADSRITPVQFNVYTPWDQRSKPGWKNPNHRPGSKYSESSRNVLSGNQSGILSNRSDFKGEISTLPHYQPEFFEIAPPNT